MTGTDHTTRTLLIPKHVNGSLVVSRGSTENVDPLALEKDSGVSTVKSFDIGGDVPDGGYVHSSSGTLLGWGLRNDVGIVEHPSTGGIWSVENSVDQLKRDGRDIHSDNPAEELNFLGYLNGTRATEQGTNFGYPNCLTVWTPSAMGDDTTLKVGSPFADIAANDSQCADTTAPRLSFQAHTAPLDIKFNDSAKEAWITFHGSWNRDAPVGYSVALVPFSDTTGEPEAASDSRTANQTIFANQDNSACPDDCFRPAGMAFDSQGRLFVSSDESGEIYMITKDSTSDGTAPSPPGSTGGSNADSAGSKHSVTNSVIWIMASLLGLAIAI